MAKRTGFCHAAHCWCSMFANNKIWVGNNNKHFPPALWTLRNVQSLRTGGSITFEAVLWTSPAVTGKGGQGFCRREMRVTLGKVARRVCATENRSPSCTPDAPPSTHHGTNLATMSRHVIVSCINIFNFIKHSLLFLLIKSTAVAAAGSLLSHSQHCPFWPSFSKT